MEKRKIIHDISASTVQVFINQISGVFIFYILSKYISKSIFGEISWCLAVLTLSFAILGFGIDQVMVKKTAEGANVSSLAGIYYLHILLSGISLIGLIWLIIVLTGNRSAPASTLGFLAIGQFLIFLTLPFKQIANGKEAFRSLLLMSTGANIFKVAGLFILAEIQRLTLSRFILIYIAAAALEFLICVYFGRNVLRIRPRFFISLKKYQVLLKESLPQLGVIVCSAGIARFDWILLGLISTSSTLAEYSFAYKVFEISTLPLLVIAPLLLPGITRWFKLNPARMQHMNHQRLITLAKFEILLSCLGSLLLNIIWSPFVDSITDNKYGRVNQQTILILSACVPFLYINNILWSVNFARNQMKMILRIFLVTFGIVCMGDLILIPVFQAEGAALAYFIGISFQTFYFIRKTGLENAGKIPHDLLTGIGTAFISGFLAWYISPVVWGQLAIALSAYLFIVLITRQISFTDFLKMKKPIRA